MLMVSRFVVEPTPEADGSRMRIDGAEAQGARCKASVDSFVALAHMALATLAAQRGYRSGQLSRAVDDPRLWCLITEWASVGAYRRALSCHDVKLHATPLLAQSLDEPSAYEVLAAAQPGEPVRVAASDLATDKAQGGTVVTECTERSEGREGMTQGAQS